MFDVVGRVLGSASTSSVYVIRSVCRVTLHLISGKFAVRFSRTQTRTAHEKKKLSDDRFLYEALRLIYYMYARWCDGKGEGKKDCPTMSVLPEASPTCKVGQR